MQAAAAKGGSATKVGNGSKMDRASLSRSLLGSDAFVETGRARRVPAKRRQRKEGPLLNCTSESRRRAQAGDGIEVGDRTEGSDGSSSLGWSRMLWATSAVICACASTRWWAGLVGGLTLLLVLATRRSPKPPKKPRVFSATHAGERLPSCWASSERAPPLPLLQLPESHVDCSEEWMAGAGVAPRWTAAERRFLRRARSEFAAQLAGAPSYLDAYGDRRLLRFLRMDPQLDEDRAIVKVGAYLAWRKEAKADEMRALVPDRGRNPRDWPHGDKLLDCIRVLQCSETYFDKRGHAVTVYQAFHWPAWALRAKVGGMSTKQLVDFATFGAEYNAVQMERIAVSRERVLLDHAKELLCGNSKQPDAYTPLTTEGWGEMTRLCAITDMSGCTFTSMMMPQVIPAVVQSVSIFVNHYPYIVGELHVINCVPLVAKVFKKALHAVVPKHIADQVQIHVHASELLASVRPANLPVQIGGDALCPQLTPPPPPPDDLSRDSRPNGTDNGQRPDQVSDDQHEDSDHPPPGPPAVRRGKSVPANLDHHLYVAQASSRSADHLPSAPSS